MPAVAPDLSTVEALDAEANRLYRKLETADNRLVVESAREQIKILRAKHALLDTKELFLLVERLEKSNRELEARLAGGAHGGQVGRASAAPEFSAPQGRVPH